MRLPLLTVLIVAVLKASAGEPLPAPVFSQPHGLYTHAIMLTLTCAVPASTIVYTTDGSIPDSTSTPYTDPLTIDETTILRARAIGRDGSSQVATSSYLFIGSVLGQPSLPMGYPDTWGTYVTRRGTVLADYEMDPDLTSDTLMAMKIAEGLRQLPIVSLVTDRHWLFSDTIDATHGGIYVHTGAPSGDRCGRGWERPVSFELFGGPEGYDLQSDCGVKIHGGQSRFPEKNPKHSLRLVWKEAYGDSVLHHTLYGEQGAEAFSTLILRAPFNNTWQHGDGKQRRAAQYGRDLWAKTIQQHMGHTSSGSQWSHLFINGLYWGMYALSERIDEDFCIAHFGGEKGTWDVVKPEATEKGNELQATDGSTDRWEEMCATAFCAATSDSAYYRLEGKDAKGRLVPDVEPLLDLDSFIDYMILNQYAGNTDWDIHNWVAVRCRTSPETGFRFFCWDAEMILGNLHENVLSPKDYRRGILTELLEALMENDLFRQRFQKRVSHHCTGGGILTPDNAAAVWDSLYRSIDTALYAESARWGDYRRDVHPGKGRACLYTVDGTFATERHRLLDKYFPSRTAIYLKQLKKQGWMD